MSRLAVTCRGRGCSAARVVLLLLIAGGVLVAASCQRDDSGGAAGEPLWRVYSIEYGLSQSYKKSALVRGAPKEARVPLAWCAWLVRSTAANGPRILVDTGFVEPPKRPPERFERVDTLLAGLDLEPRTITDVVLTHLHWDHAGNLAPFDAARVWVQRRGRKWVTSRVSDEQPKVGGLRLADVRALDAAEHDGRLELIDGRREIAPGVILHRGGGHVPGLQWVEVRTGGPVGTVVLASDTAYLYENLERRVAAGLTRTPEADLTLYDEMLKLVARPALVIPGHEPAVAKRFPQVAPQIVEIK